MELKAIAKGSFGIGRVQTMVRIEADSLGVERRRKENSRTNDFTG